MKFDYLTDESKRSLTPFYSPRVLLAAFSIIFIVATLSLLLWPRQPMPYFIGKKSIPIHFFAIASATLITYAYVNFRCGRGGLTKRDYLAERDKEVLTFEKERNFLSYGLVEFFMHSLLLIFPFLPLLILSASISGIALTDLLLAVSILFSASFLCRILGFTTYLIWGWWSVIGYWIGRIFIIFFLFLSLFILPEINPIGLLYRLNNAVKSSRAALMDSYWNYMILVIPGIILLVMINYIIINRHLGKEKAP